MLAFSSIKRSPLLYVARTLSNVRDLVVSAEILAGVKNNLPIVALESTIISHGMPYPRNLECALHIEEVIRAEGAIPATIAILNGVPHVGLSKEQLYSIAKNQHSVMKASTKDLAYCMAKGVTASTTVAATMVFAHQAKVQVFATGGIGGVHRGVEETMDVSADIFELAHTPVTVVCAGIKSILDVHRSLELLESYSVPVLGFGTNQFPAFFTNDSGVSMNLTVDSAAEVAQMMHGHYDRLQRNSGMVIAVPNPQPADAMLIQQAISSALAAAKEQNITGASITPFLLSYIDKYTGGTSLQANIALIENNARIASRIAKHYAALRSSDTSRVQAAVEPKQLKVVEESAAAAVVVGGAVVDIIGTLRPIAGQTHAHAYPASSFPGTMASSLGGVGHNIAIQLAKNKVPTAMITALGADSNGKQILQHAADCQLSMKHAQIIPAASTASYMAVHHSNKDLYIGLADMDIFQQLTPQLFANNPQILSLIEHCEMLVLDGNLSAETFEALCAIAKRCKVAVFFEPTSNHKCLLPFHAQSIQEVTLMKPNLSELVTMVEHSLQHRDVREQAALVQIIHSYHRHVPGSRSDDAFVQQFGISKHDIEVLLAHMLMLMTDGFQQKSLPVKRVSGKHIVVSLGKLGVLWAHNNSSLLHQEYAGMLPAGHVSRIVSPEHRGFLAAVQHIDLTASAARAESFALSAGQIVNSTNGAGDAFCSGMITHIVQAKMGEALLPNLESIFCGMRAAKQHLLRKP